MLLSFICIGESNAELFFGKQTPVTLAYAFFILLVIDLFSVLIVLLRRGSQISVEYLASKMLFYTPGMTLIG